MSTIKVTNIQDTSGGNQSTSAEIYQGRAKAWVNFNGTGTVAIRDDFNVSSITDGGTGTWTVNFSNSLSDADYAYIGSAQGSSNATVFMGNHDSPSQTTSSFKCYTLNASFGVHDPTVVSVSVFR